MFMESIKPQVYLQFNPLLLPHGFDLIQNQLMVHVGHKIKAKLLAKGLTQMALADIVGVSNNAVTKWIKTGQVGKENIPKVAAALDMLVMDFLDMQDDDLVHALYLLNDPKLRAILLAAELLSEHKKDILVNTSIALAERGEGTNGKQ